MEVMICRSKVKKCAGSKLDRRGQKTYGLSRQSSAYHTNIKKMNKTSYSATIFFGPNSDRRPRKYRNITNLLKFCDFAIKSGGWYINLYDQKTGKFEHRKWIKTDFSKK
jgi:hypothetical protein